MQSHELAAIMFTDIVGYTALMGNDDQKAHALLNKNRDLQRPIIEQFNGRWIKEIGDGVMASFHTVAEAVYAAIKIQEACNASKDYQLRIGIHLGDVLFENNDLFGDGVNIAARIQTAASPGSIFVSEAVHHNVSNKRDIKTRFVKEELLKNVSQPVRMYQVLFDGAELISPLGSAVPDSENSIAVLPFANMSNDADQEFFSDGITEEIINMLAQVPRLKVIGRTSSFAFKGKNLDLKLIGEQLKVQYLLEGSVRKSGNRLRITAQLIKASDGFHLYSEKFDRELEDIFAIQDEISLSILNAVKIKLFGSEKDTILKRYTDKVEAYQLYLKARYHYLKFTPEALQRAIRYLEESIRIEPEYAIAFSSLSFCYLSLWYWNWLPAEQCLPQGLRAAQKSIQLDDGIAESYLAMGRVKLHYELKIAEAVIDYKKAIAINPNQAESHVQLAMCNAFLGNRRAATEHLDLAESLDPLSLINLYFIAATYWASQDYDRVLTYGKRMVDMEPNFFGGHQMIGGYYLAEKRYKEAIMEYELCAKLNPDILCLQILGQSYALAGEKAKAMEVVDRMKKIQGATISGNSYLGTVYASLGELDIAFEHFQKALGGHEGNMLWIKSRVRLIPEFMNDPRAIRLFESMGVTY